MRHLTRKYIAILAIAAACILAIGYAFRPRKPQSPPPPADTASMPLERLSRRAEMQATTDFLSERVQYAAPFVSYLAGYQSSAIPWNTQGTLISTDNRDASAVPATLSLLAVDDPEHRKLAPVALVSHAGDTTQWAALVARRPDGNLIWTPGFAGSLTPATCSGLEYHEVAFSSPVTRAFAGGGLFDLTGNLIGLVVRCGARLSLVSAGEIDSLLKQNDSLDSKLLKRYGLRLTALDQAAKEYFRLDRGLLVTEVWAGTLAAQAGLQPGDLVVKLNGQPVQELTDVAVLAEPVSPGTVQFTLAGPRPRDVALSQPGDAEAAAQAVQLEAPLRGIAVANLAAESPAYKAGLRPGDRVLQIGALKAANRDVIEKSLAHPGSEPRFLVFDRGAMQRGVFLP